jgi:hypothetical protein
VADIYLASSLKPAAARTPQATLTTADYESVTGLFRSTLTGAPLKVTREGDGVRFERGPLLVPLSASAFVATDREATWELNGPRAASLIDGAGSVTPFEKVAAAQPSAHELQQFAGTYVSGEAEASMTAVVEDGALVLTRRPATALKLTPIYPDAFSSPELGIVIFRRDRDGRVQAFSVVQDRVWDLRFVRDQAQPTRTN